MSIKKDEGKVLDLSFIEILKINLDEGVIEDDGTIHYSFELDYPNFLEDTIQSKEYSDKLDELLNLMLEDMTKAIGESIIETIMSDEGTPEEDIEG